MNWYLIKKAKLDNEALDAEAQPFLDSGVIDHHGWEKNWYEIVGTNYQVYAEEDADPSLEGTYVWNVLRVVDDGDDEIIDHGYELAEVLKKYSTSAAVAPKPKPVEDVNFVLEKLYDIKNRNDPRAAPWLEKYRKLTGRPFPQFMS